MVVFSVGNDYQMGSMGHKSGAIDTIATINEARETRRSEHAKQDRRDMARFGKKQQLKRGFRLLSIVGLTCTLMITWEGIFLTFLEGLTDGGSAGLIYGFIFVWLGQIVQALTMAELGSMIPLAGGQYNWVSVLAPPEYSKFLSYLTGWMALIGWQASVASASYLGGSIIQGLLVLNYPQYDPQPYQATLLLYAIIFVSLFINTYMSRILPQIESIVMAVHILGYFGILIPLVYLSPHGTAQEVFQVFNNGGGWQTNGISFFVGLGTSTFAFVGIDAAAHIAEEIENASTVIPQSMVISVLINGALGLTMLIAVLFCAGNVTDTLDTATGYPFIQIFTNTTNSVAGGTAMTCIVLSAIIFAAFGAVATSSRMTWAFARERGLPGHKYLARVDQRTQIPLYSIGLTAIISLLLGLIAIGSTTVFNALTSLTVAAFYTCFTIAACVWLHRLLTNTLAIEKGPFDLGRFSIPVALIGVCYSIVVTFFSFWPLMINPLPSEMNWSIAVFGGTVIFAMVYWVVYARKFYTGPIKEINSVEEVE